MSRVNKAKKIQRELNSDDFSLPNENQQIVKVIASKGNNLFEVEVAPGSCGVGGVGGVGGKHEVEPTDRPNFLVSMPTKFRKNVWIKRGDFILVEPIEEGDKVKAEICRILTPEHIKIYQKEGIWPKKYTRKRDHESDDDMDMEPGIVRNLNRPQIESSESEESSEEV
jgi:probable RNA-binding protein EIF1AD